MGITEKRAQVMRGPRRSTCPGPSCLAKITDDQVCCKSCWFKLPKPMREEIWRLFEDERGSVKHRKAVLGAIAWLDASAKPSPTAAATTTATNGAPMQKDHCASCKAEIFWATTEKNGKAHPINYAPDPEGNVVIIAPADPREPLVASMDVGFRKNGPRYMTHFATCPDSASWSKR